MMSNLYNSLIFLLSDVNTKLWHSHGSDEHADGPCIPDFGPAGGPNPRSWAIDRA